jgi:hypothetical protein
MIRSGLCALAVWMLVATAAPSPGDRAVRERRSKEAEQPIERATAALVKEAVEVRQAGRLRSDAADFKARSAETIPVPELQAALVARVHRDPFIDAYVRWQLTSFDPPLPEMDDPQFGELIDDAPRMAPNPRAAEEIVAMFEQADDAGVLEARDLARLTEASAELDRRTAAAEAMNRPAAAWRDWVDLKLGETGPRRLHWLLERCGATIEAGWSTRAIKTRLTREFNRAAGDRSITERDSARLAAHAQQLAGRSKRFVKEITLLAGGEVDASFSTAAVDKADVQAWMDRLNTVKRRP